MTGYREKYSAAAALYFTFTFDLGKLTGSGQTADTAATELLFVLKPKTMHSHRTRYLTDKVLLCTEVA